METSFLELRCKEVINVINGKCLGNIIDIIFDCKSGCILGLVVPGCRKFFQFFKNTEDLFIPFTSICKIGDDAILVELYESEERRGAYACDVDTAKKQKLGEKYT